MIITIPKMEVSLNKAENAWKPHSLPQKSAAHLAGEVSRSAIVNILCGPTFYYWPWANGRLGLKCWTGDTAM